MFFKNYLKTFHKGFDKGVKITEKLKNAEIYKIKKEHETRLEIIDQEHCAEVDRMENVIFTFQRREKMLADRESEFIKNKKQLEIIARKMIEKFQNTTEISADAFSCIDGYRREITEMKSEFEG